LEAGGLEVGGLAVHAGFAHEVVDEGHVIDAGAEIGDHLGERFARLAVGGEFPDRLHPGAEAILERLDRFAEVGGLAMPAFEFGFVIEEIDMAGGPGHEELDDPFGAGGAMGHIAAGPQAPQGAGGGGLTLGRAGIFEQPLGVQQPGEGDPGEALPDLPQAVPTIDQGRGRTGRRERSGGHGNLGSAGRERDGRQRAGRWPAFESSA